jgi:hypothetical protein
MTGKDSEDNFTNDFNINEGILKKDPNLTEKDSYLVDRTDVELSADDSSYEKDYSLLNPRRENNMSKHHSYFQQC